MQEQEFDKLFAGERGLMAALRDMPPTFKNELSYDDMIGAIKEYEKPMPIDLHFKIKSYIDRRRKAGCSEKAIKKAVKKKFLITVI